MGEGQDIPRPGEKNCQFSPVRTTIPPPSEKCYVKLPTPPLKISLHTYDGLRIEDATLGQHRGSGWWCW